ncbi:MAG TPA: PD-(D/E)XK nuclease family protein [Acidimicrobiia bacterium]
MADRLLGDIVPLSASSLDTWLRCRREYLAAHLLGVPETDDGASPDQGLLVHDLLRHVHQQGSCHDRHHVADVLAAHGLDDSSPVAGFVERHARRCPTDATLGEHEAERARFHRLPPPMFMATGRIDAIWRHRGLLDARDYKTNRPFTERVADDPRARLQAWLLAPVAQRDGLRLRLRYEYLAAEVDDDPEPFEPDDDELAAIEEELRAIVRAIRVEDEFAGVADASVCGRCRYRSVCRDSVAPGVPRWPVPEGSEA